jgi:hypothetical protein
MQAIVILFALCFCPGTIFRITDTACIFEHVENQQLENDMGQLRSLEEYAKDLEQRNKQLKEQVCECVLS